MSAEQDELTKLRAENARLIALLNHIALTGDYNSVTENGIENRPQKAI
jgi:hypothetical protein